MTQTGETWTERDFDGLSWHDNRLRGIRLRNPDVGSKRFRGTDEAYAYDLVLDLDYILEWCPDRSTTPSCFGFRVAPAELVFHYVDHLAIDMALGYKEDMEIDEVERELVLDKAGRSKRPDAWRYVIRLHSFSGRANRIEFEATGFTQRLTGPAIITPRQAARDE